MIDGEHVIDGEAEECSPVPVDMQEETTMLMADEHEQLSLGIWDTPVEALFREEVEGRVDEEFTQRFSAEIVDILEK